MKKLVLILILLLIVSFVYAQSLDIWIIIQREQIHHWIDVPIYDKHGNLIGVKEVLQFDIRLPEYPNLPTYSIRVDYPITQQKVLDAIEVKLIEVREQIVRDNIIRQQIEDMGYLDFTLTIGE